jgi:hypothetical protein
MDNGLQIAYMAALFGNIGAKYLSSREKFVRNIYETKTLFEWTNSLF